MTGSQAPVTAPKLNGRRVARGVGKLVPDLHVDKRLLCLLPVRPILRAFFVDATSLGNTYVIHAFVLPMYVPTEEIHFNYSHRLRQEGRGTFWKTDNPNLLADLAGVVRMEIATFLTKVDSPSNFLAWAFETANLDNPHTQEATAYSMAKIGAYADAIAAIDRLIDGRDQEAEWEIKQVRRARRLKALIAKDPERAQAQLLTWEVETVRALGLEAAGAVVRSLRG